MASSNPSSAKSAIQLRWEVGDDICKGFTRPVLQDEARRLGLDTNGTKAVLTERIVEQYRQPEVAHRESSLSPANTNKFGDQTYVLKDETPSVNDATFVISDANSAKHTDENVNARKRAAMIDRTETTVIKKATKILDEQEIVTLGKKIDELFYEACEHDFRCDVVLDLLPTVQAGDFAVKYPIDDEIAAKLVYLAAGSDEPSFKVDGDRVKIGGSSWRQLFNNSSKDSALLEAIRNALAPKCDSISAQLSYVVVLKKGAAMATDWAKRASQSHFGTMVVSLPSLFKGGSLVLKHDSLLHRYAIGKVGDFDSLKCHAVAFSCDSAYFEPVTDGVSVMLIYNLNFTGPNIPTAGANGKMETQFLDLFTNLLHQPDWQTRSVGILLPTAYPYGCTPLLLANADRVAYNALIRSGLFDVEIVPVKVATSARVREPIGTLARKCYNEVLVERGELQAVVHRIKDGRLEEKNMAQTSGEDRQLLAKFTFPHGSNPSGPVVFLSDLAKLPTDGDFSEDIEPAGPGQILFKFSFRKTAMLIKLASGYAR